MRALALGPWGFQSSLGGLYTLWCILIAVYLAQADSLSNKTADNKISKANLGPTNGWKPTVLNKGAPKGRPTQARQNSTATKTSGSKTFQSRMMQSDLSGQVSSQTARRVDQADSWSPHGLVPTFTDQEQGDEMVALASEHEPSEGELSALQMQGPNLQSGQQTSNQDTVANEESRQQDSAKITKDELRSSSVGKSGRTSKSQPEELYLEEEDQGDELEEPTRIAPKPIIEQTAATPQKAEREVIKSPLISAHNSPNLAASEYYPAPTSQLQGEFVYDMNQNSSSLKNELTKDWPKQQNSSSERGWLPSLTKAGARQTAKPNKVEGQKVSAAERLAQLFGGRDASGGAFSKADVAIEYLKNMLRNKQNSTGSSQPASAATLDKPPTAGELTSPRATNVQRLTAFASKLNQMLNYTAVDTAGELSTKVPASLEQLNQTSRRSPKPVEDQQLQLTKNLFGISADLNGPPQMPQDSTTFRGFQAFGKANSGAQPIGQDPIGPEFIDPMEDSAQIFRLPGQNQQQQQQSVEHQQQLESQHIPLRQQPYASHNRIPVDAAKPISIPMPMQVPNSMVVQQQTIDKPAQIQHGESPSTEHRPPGNFAQSTKYFRMERLPTPELFNIARVNQYAQPMQKGLTLVGDPRDINSSPVHNHEQPQMDRPGSTKQANLAKDAIKPANRYEIFHRPRLTKSALEERKPSDGQIKQSVLARPTQLVNGQPRQFHNQQPQSTLISSKLYKNNFPNEPLNLHTVPQREVLQRPLQEAEPALNQHLPSPAQTLNLKPPKIVSYNYFESPNEPGSPGEMIATNYQLGDALYSSSGGVEQTLSNGELDAIHSQFMTSEHPVVAAEQHIKSGYGLPGQEQLVQGPLDFQHDQQQVGADMKTANDFRSDVLPRLQHNGQVRHSEDMLKEMASTEDASRSMSLPPMVHHIPRPLVLADPRALDKDPHRPLSGALGEPLDSDGKPKRKSLIVYLNHPRPVDMSRVSNSNEEAYNLARSVGHEQNSDSFISAKEFDSHGLSKESKHLDISNLHDSNGLKEGQDKDGLSVVVIGDAYKYKKIVLLISSKAGGLKFIPMVKDMKK